MHYLRAIEDDSHLYLIAEAYAQAGYEFTGLVADAREGRRPLVVQTERITLASGDYSILGMEDLVAVERKTLADLYGTLGQWRERFEAEHRRLARMKWAAVVIEADLKTICRRPPRQSRLNPKTVFRTMLSWQIRYGVAWIPAGSCRLAEVTTFRLLEKFFQQQQHRLSEGLSDGNGIRRKQRIGPSGPG